MCDAFDMFVYFHSPESLDLYGVKSGIVPSETKRKNWKSNQHEKQKSHSYACQSYCVNWFHWQSYLGLDNVHDREPGYGNQYPELKVNYHPQILSREKVEHDKGKK